MAYPFIRLPLNVAGVGLSTASADVTTALPIGPEADAQAHWDFGVDGDSLLDLKAKAPLVGGAPPTFDINGVTVANGAGNGLVSTIPDAGTKTQCAVVKWKLPTAAGVPIFGTAGPSPGNGGSMILLLKDSGLISLRGILWGYDNASPQIFDTGIADGAYVFVALSEHPGGAILFLGKADVPKTAVVTGTRTPSTLMAKYSVGDKSYGQGGYTEGPRVCEYMIIPAFKTIDDLTNIYVGSAQRMRDKGIVVV